MMSAEVRGAAATVEPAPPRATRTLVWLLFAVASFLLLTMPRFIYIGDPVTIRMTTIRLLTTGRISVPAEVARQFGAPGQYFFEHPTTHRFYSKYGVMNTLLYAPPLLVEQLTQGELTPFDQLDDDGRAYRCLLLNCWNILVVLVLATCLYRTALLLEARPRGAALFVILVFFGTFLWHYIRAQTVEVFQVTLFSLMFYHLVRFSQANRSAASGAAVRDAVLAVVFLGMLSLAKLVFFALFPLVLGYLLVEIGLPQFTVLRRLGWRSIPVVSRRHARLIAMIGLTTLGTLALILYLNWHRFGSPFSTGYQQFAREKTLFQPSLDGFLGYWIDPQKSLLIYCPVLVLALIGLWRLPPQRRAVYLCAGGCFFALYLLSASFVNWRGDWCYGPRYLLFGLPVLCLPAACLLSQNWRLPAGKPIVVCGLLAVSFASFNSPLSIHGAGFFSAFQARKCFTSYEDERAVADIANDEVRAYFYQPHWRINRDLRRFRLEISPFPPLEMQRGQLSAGEYQAIAESLNMVPLGNFYWPGQLAGPSPEEVSRNP